MACSFNAQVQQLAFFGRDLVRQDVILAQSSGMFLLSPPAEAGGNGRRRGSYGFGHSSGVEKSLE